MEKNKALESLLGKLKKLEAQIDKFHKDQCWWRPGYSKRYDALYAKKIALVDEFAAIGYSFNFITLEVKKAV